jgi:sporulation protein YabP
MEQLTSFQSSGIIIENRKQISISGVEDCLTFDEETINLKTKLGNLVIKGISLHIENFNTNTGELTATGKINAAVYTATDDKKSMFSKIFR